MKSRRYAFFNQGYETLFHSETLILPEKIELVYEAFHGFYRRLFLNPWEQMLVVSSSLTLEEKLENNPPHEFKYFQTEGNFVMNPYIILPKLFSEIGKDEIWEYFDKNKIKFEAI